VRIFLLALLVPTFVYALGPQWLLVSPDGRATAGQRFELMLVAPGEEPLPEQINVRLRIDTTEVLLSMKALAAAENRRRIYEAVMPATVAGPVSMSLAEREANSVTLVVSRADTMQRLTGRAAKPPEETLLSEEEPVYFVVGYRDNDWNARFQLSFKYRLFDQSSGFGAERPWLAGFYFAYTQNSLWDLSSQSKAFRDTSYRPSFFWKWERSDERTWVDAFRAGWEHESNGREGIFSRTINTAFVRPEWRWPVGTGNFEFTPKVYYYIGKDENPDIQRYRGYVDWRVRHDAGGQWITTAVARVGTANKASLLLDLSRRTRDFKLGPLSGYLHLQYFNGYGEDILDYNMRRKAQLRIGLAIVP